MSNILSEEEKNRIRKNQLRKIAELQKKKEIDSKLKPTDEKTQKMHQLESKMKKKEKAKQSFEEEIFEKEMKQRGFICHNGEWVSGEEHRSLLEEEKNAENRKKDNIEKAKERKFDKAEENYINLKIDNESKIKTLTKFVILGIFLIIIGIVILAVFGVKLIGLSGIFQLFGSVCCFGCLFFLHDIEHTLMKHQRIIYDDELSDFEYEDIKNPIRKIVRFLVKQYDPQIKELFRNRY